jgi:hypothetical protein
VGASADLCVCAVINCTEIEGLVAGETAVTTIGDSEGRCSTEAGVRGRAGLVIGSAIEVEVGDQITCSDSSVCGGSKTSKQSEASEEWFGFHIEDKELNFGQFFLIQLTVYLKIHGESI